MFNSTSFFSQTIELQYFEYFLLKVLSVSSKTRSIALNDLSVLKCQKLLFFTVAINTQSASDRSVLGSQIFTDFKAYQYGPVEETVYNSLRNIGNQLSHATLTFRKMELINLSSTPQSLALEIFESGRLDKRILSVIDKSISDLNKKNPFLINYSPFNLVELSHRWRCWSFTYEKNPRGPILLGDIEKESMLFSL